MKRSVGPQRPGPLAGEWLQEGNCRPEEERGAVPGDGDLSGRIGGGPVQAGNIWRAGGFVYGTNQDENVRTEEWKRSPRALARKSRHVTSACVVENRQAETCWPMPA